MTVSARISLAIAAQQFTAGDFPAAITYPANYERLMEDGAKVYARAGTLPANPAPITPPPSTPSFVLLNPGDELLSLRCLLIQNTGETGTLTVSGGPAPVTLQPGQVLLVTNESPGWPPAAITLGGLPGTGYKLIALGV